MTEEEKKSYNDKMADLWEGINWLDDYFEKNPDKKNQEILENLVELTKALMYGTMEPEKIIKEVENLRKKMWKKTKNQK